MQTGGEALVGTCVGAADWRRSVSQCSRPVGDTLPPALFGVQLLTIVCLLILQLPKDFQEPQCLRQMNASDILR